MKTSTNDHPKYTAMLIKLLQKMALKLPMISIA